MQLTKSDFLNHKKCPKSVWVLLHEPENFPEKPRSDFDQKQIDDGYEVEALVKRYFDQQPERRFTYQRVFETAAGLYARADVWEETADSRHILYEVKSSLSVSEEHITDACFQLICAERTGASIDQIFLVHPKKDYVLDGPIDAEALLAFDDITEQVRTIRPETEREIDEALAFIQQTSIDRKGCKCLYLGRDKQCDTFDLFNPGVPSPSIYSLPNLSPRKREALVEQNIFALDDLPADFALSDRQQRVVDAARAGAPQVDHTAIAEFLGTLTYPLYFFDFETYGTAVPLFEETRPHQQVPIQYSLHILDRPDGTLQHKDYLQRDTVLPAQLVERLKQDIGPTGNLVVWHAAFERGRLQDLARWFPDEAAFLQGLIDRLVDLEDMFKLDYVDARFDGSTSIKKVLPVLCPDLGYQDLDVQDGGAAMEAWKRMIEAQRTDPQGADIMADALRSYCERDTLAMVEIMRFLLRLYSSSDNNKHKPGGL